VLTDLRDGGGRREVGLSRTTAKPDELPTTYLATTNKRPRKNVRSARSTVFGVDAILQYVLNEHVE